MITIVLTDEEAATLRNMLLDNIDASQRISTSSKELITEIIQFETIAHKIEMGMLEK